jgi:outer membrane murein-binding lipoprotein Lpp
MRECATGCLIDGRVERTAIQRLAEDSMLYSARADSLLAAEVAELKTQLDASKNETAEAKARISWVWLAIKLTVERLRSSLTT